MTNLSPAAQAVWNAFNDVTERVGVFEDYGDALAAALRAAAEELQYRMFLPGNDPMVVDAEALFNLANELEAQ
jgi:hypothetical protein